LPSQQLSWQQPAWSLVWLEQLRILVLFVQPQVSEQLLLAKEV